MSSGQIDSSKQILRNEMLRRIQEALELRDFKQLEHWARHWIQVDAGHAAPFKWLARANVALNNTQKAAYAYGRLLDFEAGNEEARKFFADYPSSLDSQPLNVRETLSQEKQRQHATPPEAPPPLLAPDQRTRLAKAEMTLAQAYADYRLYAEAGEHYRKSFEWEPSQGAALEAARCLHRAHRGREGAQFLRTQLFHFPRWSEGRLLLGRILYDLGQMSDAQKEWQSVLQMEPTNEEALACLRGLFLRI